MNTNHQIITPLVVLSSFLTACSPTVKGSWEGVCENETYGASAPLNLTIQQHGDKIEGYLMLGGTDLIGSGPIQGVVQDNTISFTTPGDAQMFSHINWQGCIEGQTISGTYRVEPTAFGASNGIPIQMGRFSVQKSDK